SFEIQNKTMIKGMNTDQNKVFVIIESRFIESGQQFGPGTWKLAKKVADHLVTIGKARYKNDGNHKVERIEAPRVAQKAPIKATTPLPEDFPFRDKLISNGFETIESLKVADVEEQLKKIQGLGRASIVKIGI